MNDIELQREGNIKRNQEQLRQLGIYLTPSASSHDIAKRPPKKRKLDQPLPPSRSSARIASTTARPSYVSEDEYEDKRKPRKKGPLVAPKKAKEPIKQEAVAVVPAKDIDSIRAGWTAWEPTASPPIRDQESTFYFKDQPSFTPNKSPEEMIREGCFGGSYFRPLYSRRLGTTISDDYTELPSAWYAGLDVSRFLTSPTYDTEINKYKVSSGQSIEEWEAAGWINHTYDVRGWFQWYCRFYMGRRCEDDERQISRWRKCVGETGRWRRMLLKKYVGMGIKDVFDDGEDEEGRDVSPVMHQTCHHWAYERQRSAKKQHRPVTKARVCGQRACCHATFACGGSVPLSDLSTGNLASGAQNIFPSVTVRWDSKDRYIKQSRIDFPLPDHDDLSRRMLSDLLHYCQPATFGVDGRDVLDEKYRKAAKLDTSEFSTNFHPHDCGILDSIQQILLPSTIRGAQGVGIGPQGVRAELYKLNIYSAPSGKFLSHVDTPRGVMQFGSLVVCLPCQHEGGVLRVKHRGQTIDFAWGHTSQQSVQWAAFYGDCEHEVFEVTKGHRITLTYNLYYSSIGKLAQPVSAPRHLPLFDIAREMLLEQSFMRKGGIVGFFCHHQYAHSHDSGRKSIPGAFKGVDLAIFSVFQALGLKVGIHPIIQNRSENLGGLSAKDLMHGPTVPRKGDFVENCLENLSGKPKRLRGNRNEGDVQMLYQEDDANADANDNTYSTDEEEGGGGGGMHYYHRSSYSYPNGEREETTTLVGTKLHGPTFDDDYEEESEEPVTDAWPHKKVPQIIWMNEPMHKDFAHAGLKYGNEASLNYQFSAAAILVVVPSSEQRATTSHARRTSTDSRPTRDDKPLCASPSTVVAAPAPNIMCTEYVPNASPGTANVTSGPSGGQPGTSCSSFDAASGSLWGAGAGVSGSVSWQIDPNDGGRSAGPGWEWDTMDRRMEQRGEPGQGFSAVNPPLAVVSHLEEWSSSATELGDGVRFEGTMD